MTEFDYPSIGERLYRCRLENGLRISVIPKPGYSRSVAMFATDYGGADRRFKLAGEYIDTPAGVAHFLEHKMFDMPDGDNAMAEFAANGAQPNAYTSSGMTAYYFESTSDFYGNLETLLRFVSTPYFTDESVEKEQGIIAQEILMYEDDPDFVVYDELMHCLYEHNPVRDSVAGTVESIKAISPQTLYNCHRIFYNPSNMCLCVVGDVEPERVKAIAEKMLSMPGGETPERDYGPEESLLPVNTRFTRKMDVSAPQFLLGAKIKAEEGGDALLKQKILGGLALNYLLSPSAPLYNRLYEEGLINTDFSFDIDDSAHTMTVLAGGESRDPERVYSRLLAQVESIREKGIDSALWSRVKKSAYGSRIRALSSFMGLCSSMADADFGGYNCLSSFEMVEDIGAEDILEFITEVFSPERLALGVIMPAAEGGESQ